MEELYVIYIARVGENSEGKIEYDFYFSTDPKNADGEFWDNPFPVNCPTMIPYQHCYSSIKRLVTEIPFACVQDNMCFSMKDCKNKCVALAWEDISNYEDYPEPYRIVIQYGSSLDEIRNNLIGRDNDFVEFDEK